MTEPTKDAPDAKPVENEAPPPEFHKAEPTEAKTPAPETPAPKPPKPQPPAKSRSGKNELAEQLAALEARNAALAKDLDETRTGLAAAAREQAAAALGIKPAYRKFVPPDIDVRTDEGKAALEKWASEHPELVTPRTEPVRVAFAETGENVKNPLVRGAAADQWLKNMRRNNGI